MRWRKGNLHTHTSLLGSTGPASPANVVREYRERGYEWLAITDHDALTEFTTDELVLVRGQEVGKHMPGGNGPIHVNGYGISQRVEFVDLHDKIPTMQASIDAVIAAGGIACLNHPNDRGSFDHRHALRTEGASLIEVHNAGGPGKNNEGGDGRPSAEAIWDALLSGGMRIYGVASDDAHVYDRFAPEFSNPGRAWVCVRAEPLTESTIIAALLAGDFYASTGVELVDVRADESELAIEIAPEPGRRYVTRFIGHGGGLLGEQTGLCPKIGLRGDAGYARATVTASDGAKAWTQPVFLTS